MFYTYNVLVKHDLQAKENLGMVMIFTLVSAGQEWLNVKWEQIKKVRDERLLKKQIEDEEAERVSNIIFIPID